LAETNRVIPDARLTRKSILFTYSGVRPLAYSENADEQSITRRHFIHDHSPRLSGFISVVGGKLTTYRSLAEQAVNLVFRKLGRPMPACTTDKVPLPGALTAAPSTGEIVETSPKPSALASDFVRFCERFKRASGLSERVSERLLRIYGTRAVEVLRLISEDPALGETFSEDTGALAAEIVFAFRHELAQTLTDCLLRRTMVGLSSSRGIGADEAAASIAQQYLGWSADRAQREVLEYRNYVQHFTQNDQRPAPG